MIFVSRAFCPADFVCTDQSIVYGLLCWNCLLYFENPSSIIALGGEGMEFYTQNGKQRPIRLSESTRQFAYDSLHHKYGLDTQNTMAVSMDAIPNFEALSELEQYDIAVRKIACEAPVRICKNEKISGAASLGVAIEHFLPATYQGEKLFYSVSHLTADFETVLKKGINSIREKAVSAYETYKGTEQEPFAKAA